MACQSIGRLTMSSLAACLCLLLALPASEQVSVGGNQGTFWSPSFFQNCLLDGARVKDDVNGKAQMCYQRYERDMQDADEDYCCPNWRLADCLIHNVAPGCDETTRRSLTRYWEEFFTNNRDCIAFRYSLDGSIPIRCSWYYHKGSILGWIFGVLAMLLLAAAVVAVVVLVRKRRRQQQQGQQGQTEGQSNNPSA